MEVGASMAMQARAPGAGAGAGGRRGAFLGWEKQARVGSLRVGGAAGAAAVAVRAPGTKSVAPLCCVRASRGELPRRELTGSWRSADDTMICLGLDLVDSEVGMRLAFDSVRKKEYLWSCMRIVF